MRKVPATSPGLKRGEYILDVIDIRKKLDTAPMPSVWPYAAPMIRGCYRPLADSLSGDGPLSLVAQRIWESYGLEKERAHFVDRVCVWLLQDGSTLGQVVMWDFFKGYREDADGFLHEAIAEEKREL